LKDTSIERFLTDETNSKSSLGVKDSYNTTSSGTYPILFFTSIGFSTGEISNTLTSPDVGFKRPHIILTVVVFPAPLGPRSPRFHLT